MPVRPGNTFKISGFPFTSFLCWDVEFVLGCNNPIDIKALKALGIMKLCDDIDSIVSAECLVAIRECYSILDEHVLYASLSGQLLYNPYLNGFSVSIDTLEAGLQFPLHPMI
ncbi:hypothetical protein BHM03_00012571 [Ensete ventricosum]|nr:hypothetical protein BHM03_00012571 [Ensete ventricosum]